MALVTGASRGIGRAIALGLARAGADVAVTGRRADVEAVATEISRYGRRAVPLRLDVSRVEECATAVAEAAKALGRLDILVNNAGTEEVRASLDVDEGLWDRILGTNLKGAFFASQAAARAMRAAGHGGSIINICSLASSVGIATAVPYTASKSGLLGITRALSAEWAPLGIRVNGIAPGYFRTEMTEGFFADDGWQKSMLANIPLGRFGALDDLVGAAIFLASSASVYVTGHCLTVDGGYLASL